MLAFTVNSFVYFSFGNIYSSKILNYENFQQQFHSGIYQYRILSGYFLIWIYDLLSILNIDYQIFKLKFLNDASQPKMYLSFFILNTFFLILSSALMVFITETKNFIATNSEKMLMVTAAIFVIAITQFVIVPYDVSSYFFLLLFFFILIKYLNINDLTHLILLMIVIAFSTLNRESSAISISLAATLLFAKFGLKKETIIPVIGLVCAFIVVYIGMRIFSDNFSTNDGSLFAQNFAQPKNLLGILFWMVFFSFTLLIAENPERRRNIIIFHVLSAPYILMCFYTGILYEVRLYVPLFLTSLFLARTELNKIH